MRLNFPGTVIECDWDEIEGAELLRQQFGIAVIFLTGEVDKATARRAASIDPAGYLIKPVH